ncbi:MAG: lipoprotein insertase outer membrane protein LolB [Burkholderiales bacterium]|jgi:outer membrane lipoprotein LolB|nr:lipoprotein insertase outer membrane protein LolB [Burkholderiales bacterium]
MRKWWAVALAAAVLTGCVGLPRGDDDASYAMTTVDVSFHAQGRFSARYEEKAFAARFDWKHTPESDVIDIISPFGTTVASLTREGETITVQQGDRPQRTQQVDDWETLVVQAFGFPLPVKNLAYWIRGVPVPEARAAITRDAVGRFDSLRQQGWVVQYSYAGAAREPERIDICYGETVGLRFRIDRLLLLENKQI